MKKLDQSQEFVYICSGVGGSARLPPDIWKKHGEIQNSAEESHWGISRKSVCAVGVVFSSELTPTSLTTTTTSSLASTPHWTDSALPSRSEAAAAAPPLLSPPPGAAFVPRDRGPAFWVLSSTVAWLAALPQYWTQHSADCTDQTSHQLYWLDTCRKLSTLIHYKTIGISIILINRG